MAYEGLQGLTLGFKRLQGVTEGNRGIQGDRGDYRGIQGVKGGYRGLHKGYRKTCGFLKSMFLLSTKSCFLRSTLPNTFSRCILTKTKS